MCLTKRKANSGPAGEAAGAEESGPAGEAAGANIEWHDEEGGNIADRLPEMYRDWASVFSEEEINCLPDHTEYDHRIEVVEGPVPPFGPIYPLSEKESQALREYLRKELAAAKIRRSKSPAAAPIIEEEINRPPDHTEYDHRIELVEGTVPPFGPIYPLSEKELQTLREYLRKELAAGKIRRAKSPADAPIVFVPTPDGSMRLCVNYRGLGSE
jgi:hypothetical protein